MDKNEILIIKNSYGLALFKPNTRKELVIRGLNALAEDRDADYYFFKGEEYRIKGEYSKAISYYEKALQIDSDHVDALFYLGLAYYLRGLYAVDTINGLIKVSRQLLKELRREPTVQEIAKNMGVPVKKVRKILELGLKNISLEARIGKEKDNYFVDFIKKDDEDSAIKNFRKVIQKNPQNNDAFFILGLLYHNKGEYERAIKAYQEVIRINPDSLYYNNLGWAYGELEKYQEAIDAFKEAIKRNPEDADVHYGLGWVYNELKDYKKAVESYKQAILIQPGHTYAHYGLGLIYFAQGYKNAALGEYKILKDLDKNISEDLFNMIYK
ncbi:MAG TPA: tetratricopeptide repeat protein [Candidatus Paceibacterota bacterium]|nr:tetratricopeptide repeat protein [Candidatus Paceibacterota bacterium]